MLPVVPQKRKSLGEDQMDPKAPANLAELTKGEYESGHIICTVCGDSVPFRDEVTQQYTTTLWNAHRQQCNTAFPKTEPVIYTPESTAEALANPPAKRRRAKRTEDERIEYLKNDPYVAKFEPYRVLCASCDKWIRLRPNSTYCSIPWDAHRKSCLQKKITPKNVYALDERNSMLLKDPDVRKFDTERILCNLCDKWISVSPSDHLQAIQTWLSHRSSCHNPPAVAAALPPISESSKPSIARSTPIKQSHSPRPDRTSPSSQLKPDPDTLTNLYTLSPHTPPYPIPGSPTSSVKSNNPERPGYSQSSESRRRNAEQREATLRADGLLLKVEPNRVFCKLCQKWVQLRQDSSFCAYPWQQHRGKCLSRHQRRVHNGLDSQGLRGDARDTDEMMSEADELESEEDEMRGKKAKAKDRIPLHFSEGLGPNKGALYRSTPMNRDMASGTSREGSSYRLADLESPIGRVNFILASVEHLFRTTFDRSDELTVQTLLTYLSAAVPVDKYAEFDTSEVSKAAAALQDRGCIIFEGDSVRLV